MRLETVSYQLILGRPLFSNILYNYSYISRKAVNSNSFITEYLYYFDLIFTQTALKMEMLPCLD